MNRRFATLMVTVTAAGSALTGCGSGSPSGGNGGTPPGTPPGTAAGSATEGTGATGGTSGELDQVTVGVLPIAPSVAVQYGFIGNEPDAENLYWEGGQ